MVLYDKKLEELSVSNKTKGNLRILKDSFKKTKLKFQSVETFNMMRITDFDMDLPSKFAGRWRMNINMIFPQTPPTIDCYRFYFDIEEI